MDAMHVTELQTSTLKHLQGWAQEGQTLIRSARALGIDASTLAAFEGKSAPTSSPAGTRRRATRVRRPSNGVTTTAIAPHQIVEALKANPGVTRKRLAEILGVSDNVMARQIAPLEQSQKVRREGTRAQTTWFAADAVAA